MIVSILVKLSFDQYEENVFLKLLLRACVIICMIVLQVLGSKANDEQLNLTIQDTRKVPRRLISHPMIHGNVL